LRRLHLPGLGAFVLFFAGGGIIMYGARCPLPNLFVLCLCVGSLSIGVCRCMKRQSVSNVQLFDFSNMSSFRSGGEYRKSFPLRLDLSSRVYSRGDSSVRFASEQPIEVDLLRSQVQLPRL
jgi:hypothetical protein